MIYVTGDVHADFSRFSMPAFPEQKSMTKNDYVIVCGDFGIRNESNEQNYWMDWLEKKNFTTLFVDGNHENFDFLNSLPVGQWHGGNVHFIRPSVIHLMRGQLFNVDGRRILTMGGAASHDISAGILEPDDPDFKRKKTAFDKQGVYLYRTNHIDWWKEEMPSDAEYETAVRTLDTCGRNVDFIFSHCGPSSQIKLIDSENKPDRLTDFFDEISRTCEFKHWFFGHYHDNRRLSEKHICLYEQFICIGP